MRFQRTYQSQKNAPLAECTAAPDQRGSFEQGIEIAAVLEFDGDATPLVVPTGVVGLILPILAITVTETNPPATATSPGIITAGTIVDGAFLFNSAQGRQYVNLAFEFTINGSPGSTTWAFEADLGLNLDSGSPDPPLVVFTSFAGSSNQNPQAYPSWSRPVFSNFFGGQTQTRISHDGGGNITIVPVGLRVTSAGTGSGGATLV